MVACFRLHLITSRGREAVMGRLESSGGPSGGTLLDRRSQMGITIDDIERWLEEGKEEGATHVIVACDTFDYEDYPINVMPNEDVHEKVAGYRQGLHSMQKVMGVYNLSKDWNKQLKKKFNMEY